MIDFSKYYNFFNMTSLSTLDYFNFPESILPSTNSSPEYYQFSKHYQFPRHY